MIDIGRREKEEAVQVIVGSDEAKHEFGETKEDFSKEDELGVIDPRCISQLVAKALGKSKKGKGRKTNKKKHK